MKTFLVITLGCKVNQYESEEVSQFLRHQGYTPFKRALADAKDGVMAELDLCIINSCAVTAEAEAKTRKTVRQIIKRRTPRRVLVFGCAAARNPEMFREIPGVTDVVTAEETGGNRVSAVVGCLCGKEEWGEYAKNAVGLEGFGERHRAYVKIQDGCRQFCTYCIVPHLRKTLSSVPVEEVVCETRALVARGYREIVLTGLHLGYYGRGMRSRAEADWRGAGAEGVLRTDGVSLATVVRRLTELSGDFRVRISSLEAEEATDELIALMAAHPGRVCPHLHLSMQSGADSVLKHMNRPGTAEAFFTRCMAARRAIQNVALTTDIIVGFPGETEREFLETCEMARKIGFSKIHIFRFSPREGTPAAGMAGQVPGEEKQRRAAYLAELEAEMRRAFFERLLGAEMQVLVESTRFAAGKFALRGTSERYAPVMFHAAEDLQGRLVGVNAVRVMTEEDGIFGRLSDDS